MPANEDLPRATDETQPVALAGWLYNRILDILEWMTRLRATPPLLLSKGPGGPIISIALPPQAGVWVKITASASRPGMYSGRIFGRRNADLTTSGSAVLTEADFGVDPGADNCWILNSEETGQGTHDLNSGGTFLPMMFPGIVQGRNSDGKYVVDIDGAQWENCSGTGGGGGTGAPADPSAQFLLSGS